MSGDETRIARNFEEFFEQHGVKGFFTLYIQRMLVKMIQSGVRSRSGDHKTDIEYSYFFGADGKLRMPDELRKLDEDLEAYCLAKAKEIVRKLDEEGFFEALPKTPRAVISHLGELNEKLQQAVEAVLGTKLGHD